MVRAFRRSFSARVFGLAEAEELRQASLGRGPAADPIPPGDDTSGWEVTDRREAASGPARDRDRYGAASTSAPAPALADC